MLFSLSHYRHEQEHSGIASSPKGQEVHTNFDELWFFLLQHSDISLLWHHSDVIWYHIKKVKSLLYSKMTYYLKLYLRSTLTLSTNNIKAKVKCLANLDTHVPQGLAYCEVWRRSIKTFIDFYIWCVLDPIWKNKQTNKQNWLLFIKIKTQCNMSCILVHLCDHLSSLNDDYVTM